MSIITTTTATVNSAEQDGHNNTYFGHHTRTINKGRESADLFLQFLTKYGYRAEKTDSYSDRIKHIDYVLYKGEEKLCSVDLKSKSKYGWSGEIVNNYGYSGSMYSEADFLVYICKDKKLAYFVPPSALQDHYKSRKFNTDKKDTQWIANHGDDIMYTYTNTFGRISQGSQDQIFFFTQTELEKMSVITFPLY